MWTNREEIFRFINPADLAGAEDLITPEESRVLDDINRKVAGAATFDAIMDFLFERTGGILPCDRISVAFLEDRGRRVATRAVRARYKNLVLSSGYSENLAGSTLNEILDTGNIRVIGDLEEYLRRKPGSISTAAVLREGLRSSLSCPLKVEGRPVGFFFRNSVKPFAYAEREVLLHVQIAERLSQAVEKAWRIAGLEAANQGYMEMLAFASHELKSPLASMSMECDMLLEGYAGQLSDQQLSSLRRMRGKIRLLMDTTDDYLSLARFEGGQIGVSIVDAVDIVADAIYPALEALHAQREDRRITVSIEPEHGLPPVSCDPRALRTVFLNLIGNAIKYGEDGGEVRVSLHVDNSSFSASVHNTGIGFPPEESSKLFKRFSRLYIPELQKVKGTGVGLYIVRHLVDLHNGRVSAKSEYGKWAEFTFSIPQPVDR